MTEMEGGRKRERERTGMRTYKAACMIVLFG